MIDWGMALSVGLGVAFVSEITILAAVMTPKFPLKPGATWRGTVVAVSLMSLFIGGVGGYLAGHFGGRGGGGAGSPGTSPADAVTPSARIAAPAPPETPSTAPVRKEGSLLHTVHLYFVPDKNTNRVADFTCRLAAYRVRGADQICETTEVVGSDLNDFLKKLADALDEMKRFISEEEPPQRTLSIHLVPFPGEGVYDQLRQQAVSRGWKVERKDAAWTPAAPAN